MLYPSPDDKSGEGRTLVVGNKDDCEQYLQPDDRWVHGPLKMGTNYLLPLQTAAGRAPEVKQGDVMDVVPIPTASGAAGPPRIYPDTPEVERQYQAIR